MSSDEEILKHFLKEGLEGKRPDIPAKFIEYEMNDYVLYKPTKYLRHLYGMDFDPENTHGKTIEIDADEDPEWADI